MRGFIAIERGNIRALEDVCLGKITTFPISKPLRFYETLDNCVKCTDIDSVFIEIETFGDVFVNKKCNYLTATRIIAKRQISTIIGLNELECVERPVNYSEAKAGIGKLGESICELQSSMRFMSPDEYDELGIE